MVFDLDNGIRVRGREIWIRAVGMYVVVGDRVGL